MPQTPEQPHREPQDGVAFVPEGLISTDTEVLYQRILNAELDHEATEARINTLLSAIEGNKAKILDVGTSEGVRQTLEAANQQKETELVALRIHLEQLEEKLEEDMPKWPKSEKLN